MRGTRGAITARAGGGKGDRGPEEFASTFEAALSRLQVQIETACAAERAWPVQAAAGIRASLAFAAADPSAAQALTNDALAEGKDGFARYNRMIGHFGKLLLPGRAERPEGELLPDITEKMMVGGLATLIAQRLDYGRHVELPSLAPEAIQFVLTPYVGVEEARRIAAAS